MIVKAVVSALKPVLRKQSVKDLNGCQRQYVCLKADIRCYPAELLLIQRNATVVENAYQFALTRQLKWWLYEELRIADFVSIRNRNSEIRNFDNN